MNQTAVPYPAIPVEGPNPQYARMILSNIGGADSEMSAVAMYFYGRLTMGAYPEIAEAFGKIAVAEMRHLELFGAIALRLGADPRLWEYSGRRRRRYWSPRDIRYPVKAHRALTDALVSEHMAVAKYTKQAKLIRDTGVAECLQRVIQDEKEHIRILTELLHTV